MRIEAIVLAAGQSLRMGAANKLLQAVDGCPMVVRSVEALRRAGLERIVVVVGHERERVEAALAESGVEFVFNPRYAEGMGSSLAAGAAAIVPGAEGILVSLGDLPWLEAEDVRRVVDRFKDEDGERIVRPVYDGRAGHPVALPIELCSRLYHLSGDAGAKALIQSEAASLVEIEAIGPGVLRDVDRSEDLE